TPRSQQGLLEGILGVLHRAEHAVAVDLELAPVGLGQRAERPLVAGASLDQAALGHRSIVSWAIDHETPGAAQIHRSICARGRVSSRDDPTEEKQHAYTTCLGPG